MADLETGPFQSFRALFDSNPHPMWIFDVATLAFLDVNDTAVRRYGWSREEFLAMTVRDIRPSEEQSRLPGPDAENMTRHRTRSGGVIDVEVSSSPIRFLGKAAQLTVITNAAADRRLDILNRTFLSFGGDYAENIMLLVDVCRHILGGRWGGYVRLEDGRAQPVGVWGDGPQLGGDGGDCPLCRDAIAASGDELFLISDLPRSKYADADPRIAQLGLKTFVAQPVKAGGVHVGCLAVGYAEGRPLSPEDRRFFGILASAIGVEEDRRAQQRALQESEEQLRQAQKLEAIGRLAGGVAHDFNNLLTAISGCSELLAGSMEAGDPRREDVDEIRRTCGRATALTQQLLAFSRRQKLSPRVLELNESVAVSARMLRRLIPENIALTTKLTAGTGRVKADPGQLEQIILNLALNARDAMPKGGSIVLETRNVRLDEEYARRHLNVGPGDYVMLAVTDSGCGMDDIVLAQVFEPFFTTKERGKGTGLGLATVYGIVRQSGGHIGVYSEPGQGACFKVYLPRVVDEADAQPGAPTAPESLRGSETVLVVDDDAGVRALTARVLSLNGYNVLSAADAEEALRLEASHQGEIALVVTDVVMPGMSGPDLVKRLLELRPRMKTVYMSGYADKTVVHRGFLESEENFLQKPFLPGDLALKARRALDQRPDSLPAATRPAASSSNAGITGGF